MNLRIEKLAFHEPLQIVQAEVKLDIDGVEVINEPLCIDVGLPALLLSACSNTKPNRLLLLNNGRKCRFLYAAAEILIVEHLLLLLSMMMVG